jgi:hypothetical protein
VRVINKIRNKYNTIKISIIQQTWVQVKNFEKPELFVGGLGAARAPGGTRATPGQGSRGQEAPGSSCIIAHLKA